MPISVENQRSSSRVQPKRPHARILGLDAVPVPTVVLDESFGGIGLAAPIACLATGVELDIELDFDTGRVRNLAVVRYASPLPSGCRLGLEWKAEALSRQLRNVLTAPQRSAHPLARILPGGLSMMWKLFEAERWDHLIASADRLKKETAAAQGTKLFAPIESFQQRVAEARLAAGSLQREQVRTALDELINACLEIVQAGHAGTDS